MRTLERPDDIAAWLRERVTGALRCDSRQVRAGDGFVAWPGAATDGRRFVEGALRAGAAAALVERDGLEAFGLDDERILAVPGLKALAGGIASAFYGQPGQHLDVVAITGTNGKTSTAWWTAQLLWGAGKPCAVIGTLGIGHPPLADTQGHALVPTGLTTPDPVLLQSQLRVFVDEGIKACAIEASSIGLQEGRLNATPVRVAVFTNFTQDHLDFHGGMDAYWQAKLALFGWAGLKAAVVNLDDPKGPTLAADLAVRGLDVWTVGLALATRTVPPRLVARDTAFTHRGMRLIVVERDLDGREIANHPLSLPLVGAYNVSNLLCVLAAARALGVSLVDAIRACDALTPVPGRMEQVRTEGLSQPMVLVDYAHTSDALEKALQALQPLAQQRGGTLWVLIGCGGDRDPGKRPLMAAAAERDARRVVLTSDNPRGEDPAQIIEQMRAGLSRPEAAWIEVDRAAAIARVIAAAQPDDVVLIAGKGHEDYQEVRGVRLPFSDLTQAEAALELRGAASGGAA
jgi:UDP-N-acetylmuramyl-tripeptide synthetase